MTPSDVFYILLVVLLILIIVLKGDFVFSFEAPWITFMVKAKEKDRETEKRKQA